MDWTIIITIILVITGAGIALRFTSKKNNARTKQSRNIVGGDQAGRDINKK